MGPFLALYLLAITDGVIAGYRDALGRNPLHRKGYFYVMGCVKGACLVHGVLVVVGGGALVCYQIAGGEGVDPEALTRTAQAYSRSMALVYGVYAMGIAAGLFVYILPMFEVRSYITIGLFGVLTVMRPWVIAAGVIVAGVAVYGEPGWWLVCGLASVAGVLMSQLERIHRRLGWQAFDWDALLEG